MGLEKKSTPSDRPPSSPFPHNLWELYRKIRKAIEQLSLPKGLTPELGEQMLKQFEQKMQTQRARYGFIPKSHYSMTVDICMRETLQELLPPGADRRTVHYYLIQKQKKSAI